MNEPDKRVVRVIRVVLALWGLAIGWAVAVLILRCVPPLSKGWHIAVIAADSVLFGLLFATLACPVSVLAVRFTLWVRKLFSSRPLYDTGSILLGLAIGALFGILAAAVTGIFTDLVAVQVIVAIIVAAFGAYLGYLACRKWLKVSSEREEDVEIEYGGYVLCYGAFSSDRIAGLCELCNGRIYILDKTLRRLIDLAEDDDEGERALERYLAAAERATISVAAAGERGEEEEIAALARKRLLKIIAGDEKFDGDVPKVLRISEL